MLPTVPEIIAVPEDQRDRAVSGLPISARLARLFEYRKIQRLGDLHDLTLDELACYRNCGPKTMRELRGLLGMQRDVTPCLVIPREAHDINPFDLPISTRLAGVLAAKGIARLGDLLGCKPEELQSADCCGRTTLRELQRMLNRVAAGEFSLDFGPFTTDKTAELLNLVDEGVAKLPKTARKLIHMRFVGGPAGLATQKAVGRHFNFSGSRASQVKAKLLIQIKKAAGLKLSSYLRGVAGICAESVCPLTPALLTHWLSESASKTQWQPAAYVRLLGELDSFIPSWPQGQQPGDASDTGKPIITAVAAVLRSGKSGPQLSEVFGNVCAHLGPDKPTVLNFLGALKRSQSLIVECSDSGQATVRLRRLQIGEAAKEVLRTSKRPLTAEEILSKARTLFGSRLVPWTTGSFRNALCTEDGVFRLGPRSFGLQCHIKLPVELWEPAREAVYLCLKGGTRTVSTGEIISGRRFVEWFFQTNKYELAQILRGDNRFVDLGRHHFGLAEWGVTERQHLKDLVPGILARAGRPMTSGQILQQLLCLRPVDSNSIITMIRRAAGVCDCEGNRFGLISWDDSIKRAGRT